MSRVGVVLIGIVLAALPIADCAASGSHGSKISEQKMREVDPMNRILWSGRKDKTPEFLPQSVLLATARHELPIDGIEKGALDSEVRRQKDGAACSGPVHEYSTGEVFDLTELLGRFWSVARGVVVAVSPGWDVRDREVAEATYVAVEEVIFDRDSNSAPPVGEVVGLVVSGGEILVEGIRICNERKVGSLEPTVGDEVLIAGNVSPDDSRFYRNSAIFPVVDGQVLAQPVLGLRKDQAAVALSHVRETLSTVEVQEQGP